MLNLLINVNLVELERDFDSRVVTNVVKPPIVVRLDGAGFGKALRDFNWPRDERVHRALIKAAVELMRAFSGEYALVISDEINVFLLSYVPFNGREYKLISSMAGLASAWLVTPLVEFSTLMPGLFRLMMIVVTLPGTCFTALGLASIITTLK